MDEQNENISPEELNTDDSQPNNRNPEKVSRYIVMDELTPDDFEDWD